MTEPSNEVACIDMPILNPDLIQPQDYLRPIIGASIYGLLATLPGTLMALSVGLPFYHIIGMQMGVAALVVGILLISAMVHHFLWWHRLKEQGAKAFIAYEDLEMPLEEAFELCLAATTQIPKSTIETFEDGKCINLRVRGNFWVTVDRLVDIKFDSLGEGKTRVIIDSKFRLTAMRSFLISKIWGPKWAPIVYRIDIRKNKQLLGQLTDYLQRVPEWNHKYIYGESFGGERVA